MFEIWPTYYTRKLADFENRKTHIEQTATNMKPGLICTTCGTQYPPDEEVPELCTICNDDRQYIGAGGQKWTTSGDLKMSFQTKISPINESLVALKLEPDFAIANRAILVKTPEGNILWDCIPLLDSATIAYIQSIGGLKAIAFSHPHYYSNMNEWAKVFDCPVYIHEADRNWVMYRNDGIRFWDGDYHPLWDGIRICHTGGHFPGSCVLHIPAQSDEGSVLCGDTLYISRSKRHTAVMFSYPNQILLSRQEFDAFYKKTSKIKFDNLYGAFEDQDLTENAYTIFNSSMERYMTSYGLGK